MATVVQDETPLDLKRVENIRTEPDRHANESLNPSRCLEVENLSWFDKCGFQRADVARRRNELKDSIACLSYGDSRLWTIETKR